jgi:hypothetical protein
MTIATSVVVHPSSALRLALIGMSSVAGVAAAMILLQDDFSDAHLVRIALGLICAILACAGFFQAFRSTKTFHIDISGIGQMRLTQYSGVSAIARASQPSLDVQSTAVVQMLSDSTLWPWLLVLRLKPENGAVVEIPVLPDCLCGESFHALLVACRWIAARAIAPVASAEQ